MPDTVKPISYPVVIGEPVSEIETKRPKEKEKRKAVMSYLVSAAACVGLLTCVFSINKVPSESMQPTFKPKSFIINWRLPYLVSKPIPCFGDVIVFKETGGQHRFLVSPTVTITDSDNSGLTQ